MTRHDPAHEALLERVLVGDDAGPAEIERLRACPQCGPKLAELERARADLERWGAGERAAVEEALRAVGPDDRRLAERAWRRLPPGPRRAAWPRFALAAAVLLVVGVWLARDRLDEPARPDPVFLGERTGVALAPDGPGVGEYDAFRWQPRRTGGETYALLVWNEGEDEPAIDERRLRVEVFEPTAEQAARLGPAIRWEVHLLDAAGGFVRVLGSASASR